MSDLTGEHLITAHSSSSWSLACFSLHPPLSLPRFRAQGQWLRRHGSSSHNERPAHTPPLSPSPVDAAYGAVLAAVPTPQARLLAAYGGLAEDAPSAIAARGRRHPSPLKLEQTDFAPDDIAPPAPSPDSKVPPASPLPPPVFLFVAGFKAGQLASAGVWGSKPTLCLSARLPEDGAHAFALAAEATALIHALSRCDLSSALTVHTSEFFVKALTQWVPDKGLIWVTQRELRPLRKKRKEQKTDDQQLIGR